jgi:23S rRNA (guanosine2251-2'-O)-methyltransferase
MEQPSVAIKKRRTGPIREGRTEKPAQASASCFWLYGLHSARAALGNPRRKIRRALVTNRAQIELGQALVKCGIAPTMAAPDNISRMLPPGAVHQGVALLCEPLPALDLEDVLENAKPGPRLVAVLDQVTDPHNEGAILRSAAAFGVAAVIVQDRHSPPESGVLAKAASGALDIVPRVSVVNIARALEELGRFGFWRIALAGDGDSTLREAAPPGDVAIVLGAEGVGLRRLVRERCDISASIPMGGDMESLNVSNAAAIAFYELRRKP